MDRSCKHREAAQPSRLLAELSRLTAQPTLAVQPTRAAIQFPTGKQRVRKQSVQQNNVFVLHWQSADRYQVFPTEAFRFLLVGPIRRHWPKWPLCPDPSG